MSQFARTRFREQLAWENSEQRLIATYRHLLGGQASASLTARADTTASSIQGQ
jgi:hypothetical protein